MLSMDLHSELLAVKALLRPYFLPFIPLRSLLALRMWSVPLGNLMFSFTIDCWMRASRILTFWSSNSRVRLPALFLLFISVYFFRSCSKLLNFLLSYDPLLFSMHSCTPHLFPYILMSPNLMRVWAVPLFFLTFSLPVVASIFTAELCAIFIALSYFVPRQ